MSRLLWIPVGAVSAIILSVVGCGGIGGADGLFDSGSAGAGGATGAGGAASAVSASAATTGETTSGVTTSSASATSSSVTSSGESSSAATTGASASSASSSSSSSAAASSSSGGVVQVLGCGGTTTCPLGDENACCWSKFATPSSGECVKGSPDTDGCKTFNGGYQSRLECQNSAQCGGGGVCCGHRILFYQQGQQKFFYESLSCVDTCPASDVTICDPTNASDVCPMVATQGGMVPGVCKTSTSLPTGYFVCGAP